MEVSSEEERTLQDESKKIEEFFEKDQSSLIRGRKLRLDPFLVPLKSDQSRSGSGCATRSHPSSFSQLWISGLLPSSFRNPSESGSVSHPAHRMKRRIEDDRVSLWKAYRAVGHSFFSGRRLDWKESEPPLSSVLIFGSRLTGLRGWNSETKRERAWMNKGGVNMDFWVKRTGLLMSLSMRRIGLILFFFFQWIVGLRNLGMNDLLHWPFFEWMNWEWMREFRITEFERSRHQTYFKIAFSLNFFLWLFWSYWLFLLYTRKLGARRVRAELNYHGPGKHSRLLSYWSLPNSLSLTRINRMNSLTKHERKDSQFTHERKREKMRFLVHIQFSNRRRSWRTR